MLYRLSTFFRGGTLLLPTSVLPVQPAKFEFEVDKKSSSSNSNFQTRCRELLCGEEFLRLVKFDNFCWKLHCFVYFTVAYYYL